MAGCCKASRRSTTALTVASTFAWNIEPLGIWGTMNMRYRLTNRRVTFVRILKTLIQNLATAIFNFSYTRARCLSARQEFHARKQVLDCLVFCIPDALKSRVWR